MIVTGGTSRTSKFSPQDVVLVDASSWEALEPWYAGLIRRAT
jgi:hypothetical protein